MTHSFPKRRSSDLRSHVVRIDADPQFLGMCGCRHHKCRKGEGGRDRSAHQSAPIHRRIRNATRPSAATLAAQMPTNQASRFHQRSEEHTSELQSLMRISYAVFCLQKKTKTNIVQITKQHS